MWYTVHNYYVCPFNPLLMLIFWGKKTLFPPVVVWTHSTSSSAKHCALTILWLIVGSLVRSIWNTGGGRVCCRTCSSCCGCPHTAMALVKWSTPFSYSPWASSSSPSWISSRKNFWTASASFRSGSLESPALSLASFCFFLPSWPSSGAPMAQHQCSPLFCQNPVFLHKTNSSLLCWNLPTLHCGDKKYLEDKQLLPAGITSNISFVSEGTDHFLVTC